MPSSHPSLGVSVFFKILSFFLTSAQDVRTHASERAPTISKTVSEAGIAHGRQEWRGGCGAKWRCSKAARVGYTVSYFHPAVVLRYRYPAVRETAPCCASMRFFLSAPADAAPAWIREVTWVGYLPHASYVIRRAPPRRPDCASRLGSAHHAQIAHRDEWRRSSARGSRLSESQPHRRQPGGCCREAMRVDLRRLRGFALRRVRVSRLRRVPAT